MTEQTHIFFHYTIEPFHFPNRTRLKQFLQFLLREQKKQVAAINVVFCDDAYLLELNQEYLDHDTFTDIITFELSLPAEPLLSDIFISVERVRANALELGVPFQQELHRVIFHGFLHLCGFKDKTQQDQLLMRQKENDYLNAYFVPRGTFSQRF